MAAPVPCGSITGAPKRRVMQIIAELETTPRGLYTGPSAGSMPWPMASLGGAFGMSVAIRTLALGPQGDDGLRRGDGGEVAASSMTAWPPTHLPNAAGRRAS